MLCVGWSNVKLVWTNGFQWSRVQYISIYEGRSNSYETAIFPWPLELNHLVRFIGSFFKMNPCKNSFGSVNIVEKSIVVDLAERFFKMEKIEIRAVIKYLVKKGLSAKDIEEELRLENRVGGSLSFKNNRLQMDRRISTWPYQHWRRLALRTAKNCNFTRNHQENFLHCGGWPPIESAWDSRGHRHLNWIGVWNFDGKLG